MFCILIEQFILLFIYPFYLSSSLYLIIFELSTNYQNIVTPVNPTLLLGATENFFLRNLFGVWCLRIAMRGLSMLHRFSQGAYALSIYLSCINSRTGSIWTLVCSLGQVPIFSCAFDWLHKSCIEKIQITTIFARQKNRNYYKVHQKLCSLEKQGVYKIPCETCSRTDMGQTTRRVSVQVVEHKLAVRKGATFSALAHHFLTIRHKTDFYQARMIKP